jgi:hypothetical protein
VDNYIITSKLGNNLVRYTNVGTRPLSEYVHEYSASAETPWTSIVELMRITDKPAVAQASNIGPLQQRASFKHM